LTVFLPGKKKEEKEQEFGLGESKEIPLDICLGKRKKREKEGTISAIEPKGEEGEQKKRKGEGEVANRAYRSEEEEKFFIERITAWGRRRLPERGENLFSLARNEEREPFIIGE